MADLYRLIGDTVVRDAIVANAMIDSAITWHKYVSHMSKQGLKVLSNQNLLPGLSLLIQNFVKIVYMKSLIEIVFRYMLQGIKVCQN